MPWPPNYDPVTGQPIEPGPVQEQPWPPPEWMVGPGPVQEVPFSSEESVMPPPLPWAGVDAVSGPGEPALFEPEPPPVQIGPATRVAAQALPEIPVAQRAGSVDEAMLQRGQAVAEQGGLEARQAEMSALGRSQAIDETLRRQKEEEAAQAADWKYAESERKQIESEARQQRDAKVDPARLFHNNETWQNVALIGSAFLGGFMAPMNGGRNVALETIQEMIDRDIKAQEANLVSGREGLALRRGLYTDFVAATGDRIKARALATAKTYDLLIEKAKAEAAQFDSPIIKAQYAGKIAEYEEARQRSILKAEFDKREEAREERKLQTQEYGAQTDRYSAETGRKQVGLGYAKLAFDKAAFTDELRYKYEALGVEKDKAKAKAGDDIAKGAVIYASDPALGPQGIYRAQSPEEATQINKEVSVSASIIQNAERLDELYRKTNGWDPLRITKDVQGEAEALTQILSMQLAVAGGQGQIGDKEGKRFEAIAGKPDAWFEANNRARLKAARESVSRHANNNLRRTFSVQPDGTLKQWNGYWQPGSLNPEGFTPGGKVGVPNIVDQPGMTIEEARRQGSQVRDPSPLRGPEIVEP